jgi:hypothetical protein
MRPIIILRISKRRAWVGSESTYGFFAGSKSGSPVLNNRMKDSTSDVTHFLNLTLQIAARHAARTRRDQRLGLVGVM